MKQMLELRLVCAEILIISSCSTTYLTLKKRLNCEDHFYIRYNTEENALKLNEPLASDGTWKSTQLLIHLQCL